MTLRFTVPGHPVGKNESKGFSKGRFFVPTKTRLWQRHVAVAAHDAISRDPNWPQDPFLVKQVAYRIHRYNVRGDADRGDTYLVDALQVRRWWTPRGERSLSGPIGAFANDSSAYCDGSYPSVSDERGPRVEVELVLKALRSPAEADALRRRWYENEIRRAAKKAKIRTKKADVCASASVKRKRDEIARIEENLGIRLPLGDL